MDKNSNNERLKNIFEKSDFKRMNVVGKVIYKYMPVQHFLSSFFKEEIYLANPKTWQDPFENNYQNIIKNRTSYVPDELKDLEKLREFYPFATCFASGLTNEQASWNAYVKGNVPVVRVAIDFQKFIEELSEYKNKNNEHLYISCMEYRSRKRILKPEPLKRVDGEENIRLLYIKNFSLKQDAYEFEGEIRLTLLTDIENREESSRILTGINWKNFIHHITLPPVFGGNDEEVFTLKKVLKMTMDPDIKLYKSTLYEIKNLTEERIY